MPLNHRWKYNIGDIWGFYIDVIIYSRLTLDAGETILEKKVCIYEEKYSLNRTTIKSLCGPSTVANDHKETVVKSGIKHMSSVQTKILNNPHWLFCWTL